MLKSRIAKKLSVYFMASLLIFSVTIGSFFIMLFRNHVLNMHKDELQKRAESIAETLSDFYARGNTEGGRGGYGVYMRFIGEIAGADVWIVDENYNLVTAGKGQNGKAYHYNDLPENASEVIEKVFDGKTFFSENFSNVLSELTLTVGVPIIGADSSITGAVLIHSPVESIKQTSTQGIVILAVSIALALLISIVLGIALSVSFTKPLNKMKQTALRLSKGDYTVQNEIVQNDEIGDLAIIIDELANRLELAKHESERLEEMRKSFVTNISHELRTPVTVLRGSLEILCDKIVTEPDKVDKYHTQMLSETRFLERLVGDLLDLSRLQSADFIIEKNEVDMCDLLPEVMRSAVQLASEKQIEIIAEKWMMDKIIDGDYSRLRQMLMIVLDNAIKFTPKRGKIWVDVKDTCISITDSGKGIDSEYLPHIFERFYKTHGEQNKTGTGLGLAIAKQIAVRHGIELIAKNSENKGATFVFKFP